MPLDTLTHIVIGASIGAAFSPRHGTRRMMVVGSVLQTFPDADVLANIGVSPSEALLIHRGFTHSILFAVLTALLVSLWSPQPKRLQRSAGYWFMFSLIQLLTHDFLDAFNAYGTALFIPFSFQRISFHSLFVIDPLFSVVPGVAVLLVVWFRKNEVIRVVLPFLALVWCGLYLLISIWIKNDIDAKVRQAALFDSVHLKRYFSTPMPFTNLGWYLIAEVPQGFYVGYRSVFEKGKETRFIFVPQADSLLTPYSYRDEVTRLKIFSDGYWLITKDQEQHFLADLRFGIRPDWQSTDMLKAPDFVFRYQLDEGADNKGVLQRGRMTSWGSEGFYGLMEKIFPFESSDQSSR